MISIITVTLNSEKTINRLIKSLKSQDVYFEWVVIDGKSTDQTLSYVKKSGIKNIRLISEPDLGIYDAMNKGINFATGKWLLFLNSDDELIPNTLSFSYEYLRDNHSVDIVSFSCRVKDGNLCYILKPSVKKLFYKNTIPHPSTFINKFCFENLKYDLRYKIAADYDLFCHLHKLKKKFILINKPISIHYRGGASSNLLLSEKETEDIIKKYYGSFIFRLNAIARYMKYLAL
jgi:glycosyltransferase involved in cell wall biosynthesis